ncbi:nucleoside-diphosphate sugar epimerase/dehydratase [Bacillota bacterium]
MKKYSKIVVLVFTDVILINTAFILALLLRFDLNTHSPELMKYLAVYAKWSLLITVLKVAANAIIGLYSSLWEYASIDELIRVFITASFGFLSAVLTMIYFEQTLPRSIYIMVFVLDILFLGGSRLGFRLLRSIQRAGSIGQLNIQRLTGADKRRKQSRVLIIGAGDAGASMIKEIDANPAVCKRVVGVIDDNPAKIGTRIVGKKVLGNRDKIRKIALKYRIDEIIIAIPSGSRKEVQAIAAICGDTGCKTSILPAYIDLIDGKVSISKLKRVDIADLLGREPVSLNIGNKGSYIEDKIVLVTGAGGSIGSELCRQLASRGPRKLVALDIYENNLFELCIELHELYPELELEPVIASVQSEKMLKRVFKNHQPHVVFHAAAHKHVPLMEKNPREALLNNVIGTKNMIDVSERFGVERFILISTDKAVNPTNIMGATKRIAEMLLQNKSGSSHTIYSAVRFGNVLGSNGSVIPIFKRQIEQGGPVTVTHREVTRYFMTIPEAVGLVIQTGAMAGGGEIFILDMGEPVKIKDLAENLIRLSGYVPYRDIDIVYTGLRPGEKLYEELLLDEEGIESTSNGGIFIGGRTTLPPAMTELLNGDQGAFEKEIIDLLRHSDADIKEWLHSMVPGYTNSNEDMFCC